MSNLIKIRPVRANLFQAVSRTNGQVEANSRFSQCCLKIRSKTVSLAFLRIYWNRIQLLEHRNSER